MADAGAKGDHRVNRIDAIAKVESTRAEWDALVGSVPDEVGEIEAWPGGWTLRDLIAHVDFYEWWTGEFCRLRDWPVVDSSLDTWDVDIRNEAIYRLNHNRTLADIKAASPGMHQHLVDALEAMTDGEYADPHLLGVEVNDDWSVEALLASGTWNHYPQHRADIDVILKAAAPE